ncbi:MAG TPA: hypothetical protein VMC85_14600 [Desulfomonilaceae bacterium]|nr:hypothetical protein [Desulfomonilaceae bacterium]
MRKVAGLFLVVILMLLVPALAAADLFGLGMPWGNSWGQAYNGCGGCCDPGLMSCPSVYIGYEIRQGRERKPFNFGLDFDPPLGVTYRLNTDFSDPGGLWLGISKYCQIADKVGIMASGWYLFPADGDAEESYGFPNVAAGNRVWTTKRSWGWIDAAMVLGSPCGLNLITGFRWDSYSVGLSNPTPTNPSLPSRGTPLDEGDLTMNSYIPLIGTQFCCGGPCCGLLVRVLGFPWVPGNLTYGETGFLGITSRLRAEGNYDTAYFLEVFSEYSRNCFGFGCLGVFARWNYLDVKGHTNQQLHVGFGPIRTSWTIGGRVALDFNLPF